MNKILNLLYKLIQPLILFLKQKAKLVHIPGFQKVNLYQVIKFLYNQDDKIKEFEKRQIGIMNDINRLLR